MDIILGAGGISARIPHALRDVSGLAYTAYSDIIGSAGLEPGEFIAYLAVAPDRTAQAVAGLLTEINRIRNEPVSAAELAEAKSYLIASRYFTLQGTAALADFLLFCEYYGLGFDYLEKYSSCIARVSARDVQQAARQHLHPEAYTLVTAGPAVK
jgi:zinc protease